MNDVSIVIVNYQGGDRGGDRGGGLLAACLGSLAPEIDRGVEVIVVDNASPDRSADIVRERYPAVRLLALERNVGFAAGNNAGAREARGRYIAFLNNDAEAQPGWVEALVSGLDQNPWAALATSRIVYKHDPAILDSAGDGFSWWGGAFKRGHGQPASSAADSREVFGACGAAFMIRREVFEQVGGFDEDFFLSHEDVDLSYRVQLLGLGCIYVPNAVVLHAGSATLGRVSPRAVFYGQRNLEWVFVKDTPWPLLLKTLPAHVVYTVAAGVYYTGIGFGGPFVAAKWAALKGMPAMWRKRGQIHGRTTSATRRVAGLMERGWIGLKWREKRFDLRLAKPSSR